METKERLEPGYIELWVPVRYDDEDMPYDFPGRKDGIWNVAIDLWSHQIVIDGLRPKVTINLHMKVCDEGTYKALAVGACTDIVKDEQNYVPGFFPGDHYGDYLILNIQDGVIVNWTSSIGQVKEWITEILQYRD